MSRFLLGLSVLFITIGSIIAFVNTRADETVSTTVNPMTQETTTTQVNPVTQDTTTTTVNPVSNQTTVTKTDADTGVSTTTVITTPAPAPQEVVAIPSGYSNCFMVAAGWSNNIWVPEHKVCQYTASGTSQGSAWVDGYWNCSQYSASEGACTKWDWVKGHWVSTFSVY
jgi:hypothetical protein